MLLRIDPKMFNTMPAGWQSWFRVFMESLGLSMDTLTGAEYSPQCGMLKVWVNRLNPETGSPYVDPENDEDVAHDIFLFFLDKRPTKISLWEWERAMIAYQGDQGA